MTDRPAKELSLTRAKLLVSLFKNSAAICTLAGPGFEGALDDFRRQKQLIYKLISDFGPRHEAAGLDLAELVWMAKTSTVVDRYGTVMVSM